MQTWLAVHLNRPVKEQRLDNLAVFSVPRRFCNCYGFFLVFEILNFRQINSTQPTQTRSQVLGFRREITFSEGQDLCFYDMF